MGGLLVVDTVVVPLTRTGRRRSRRSWSVHDRPRRPRGTTLVRPGSTVPTSYLFRRVSESALPPVSVRPPLLSTESSRHLCFPENRGGGTGVPRSGKEGGESGAGL